MSRNFSLQLVCWTLLCAVCVQGQTQQQNTGATPAATAPQADNGYIPAGDSQPEAVASAPDPTTPWLPVAPNGEMPPSLFAGELQQKNTIRGGLTFVTAYDDNAALENGKAVSNTSYTVLPNFAFEQSRTRMLLDIGYAPGFTVNQNLSGLNSNNQGLNSNFQYRLSQYWTLRIHDDFSSSNNPYTDANAAPDATPGSVLHQPSPVLYTLSADRLSNLGVVDLLYQIGEGTMIGGSGSSYLLNYSNVGSGSALALLDTQTESGDFFYKHRLFPNQWLGFTYSYQRLSFNGDAELTNSHTGLLFYTLNIKPHISISLFGGADYADTEGQLQIFESLSIPISQHQWSPSGGGTFGWQREHTAISATVSRRVDNGGGLLGTVNRYSGNMQLRRQFTRTWTGTLGFAYDDDRSIDALVNTAYRTWAGTAGVQHDIGKNFAFGLSYSRAYQTFGQLLNNELSPDHNRASVTLSYFFSRPLGK